jgi:hypothetical protein
LFFCEITKIDATIANTRKRDNYDFYF